MRLTGSGNTTRMSDPKRQERHDTKATGQENTQIIDGNSGYTEKVRQQSAGSAPGAVAGAMAGAAGASVAKKAASANQQVQPSPAGNMRWGSMTDTTRGNPKTASPVNPLLTGKGATDAAVADQINQSTKTLTQMYLENKDSPLVEEYYQILKAQEDEAEPGNDAALDQALGEAMYKSYAKYSPDGATAAARQAQANAYDAARRAAGGAGTSYAATAGAKAYSDAYESYKDQEADRETEAFETALTAYDGTNGETIREWLSMKGLDQPSVDRIMNAITGDYGVAQEQVKTEKHKTMLSDFMGTMLSVYDGTNQEGLRQLAAYNGITDEEFDSMLAAVEKDRETSTESRLSDEAQRIYEYLTGTDEEGNQNYQSEFRNTIKQDLLNLGYSEAAIEEALDRYDDREDEYYEDVSNILTEALSSGMTDKVYEAVGFTAEAWAEKDENDRGEIILETMGKMVKSGKMDSSVFAEQALSVAMENVDDIMEEYKGRNWWEKTWDFLTSTERDEALSEVAECVVTLKAYKDSGYMTDDQYQYILEQIASESDIEGILKEENDWKDKLMEGVKSSLMGSISPIFNMLGSGQKLGDWNMQRMNALNDLLDAIKGE